MPTPLILCVISLMGIGKLQHNAKFDVASFCHCRNIKGKTENLRELPQIRTTPTLVSQCDFIMGMSNLRTLASAIADVSKGNPKIYGAALAQNHVHFSYRCYFATGLGELHPHSKFEVEPLQKY